jgi:hypothetical protein
MRLFSFLIFLATSTISTSLFANYAWIPKEQHLELKIGGEFFSTSQNFNTVGASENIIFQNQQVGLEEFSFFVDADYGITENISGTLRLPFQSESLNVVDTSGQSILSSSGVGDINTALKWNFKKNAPILTAEINFKIPTESYDNLGPDDLLRGDANFDLGFMLHAGYQFGQGFLDVSPGIVFRFGGYASGFLGKAMVGVKFRPAYIYAFSNLYTSFTDDLLFDPDSQTHDIAATGGSYHTLSGSPSYWEAGLRGGVRISGPFSVEGYFSQTLWGRRAADAFIFGFNVVVELDFSKKDTRTKTREIPFDSPNDTSYRTEEKKESEPDTNKDKDKNQKTDENDKK